MSEQADGFSLKRQLLVVLLGSIAAIWIAITAFSYFDAQHEIDELLDAHLAQSAALLVAQVGHDLEEIDVAKVPPLHKRGRRVAFQLWEHGTELRMHSANAPLTPLSAQNDGFSDAVVAGEEWRVFSGWDDKRHSSYKWRHIYIHHRHLYSRCKRSREYIRRRTRPPNVY